MNLGRFIRDLRHMCAAVHNGNPPTPAYADRAAKLLLITACHESDGFEARRQYRFSPYTREGAFSLFQIEFDSIRRSLLDLEAKTVLRANVEHWLIGNDDLVIPVGSDDKDIEFVLGRLQRPEGDRWAMVLARLHYFRIPEPIPAEAKDMCRYAKQHWNTPAGKATPTDYAVRTVDELWDCVLS